VELQVSTRSHTTASVKELRIPIQDRVFIGRGAECEIRIDGDDISRRHVGLKIVGGQVTATDLSANGSLLNGTRLQQNTAQPLKSGDVLGLPGFDVFIQNVHSDVAANAPTADAGMKANLLSTIHSFPFAERMMVVISLASLALVWMYFKS